MKKIISFILVVCLILLIGNFTRTFPHKKVTDNALVWDLCSISEFSSELENVNVNVESSEDYDICVLIGTKDILPSNAFEVSNIPTDANDIDVFLEEHREKVQNYYSAYNENIATILGLNDYTYYVSYYSPYIEIVFDNLSQYEQWVNYNISSVENNEHLLSSISSYAQLEITPEATVDDSTYGVNYPITEAFEDIGVSNSQYTGSGVNVGIIDWNIPHITDNLKPGKYTMLSSPRPYDPQYHYELQHGTVITSIIGGTSGIAEDVHFYCLISSGSVVNDSNFLISNYGVSIINMSLGAGILGKYTQRDACIDYIVSTSNCTFVVPTGNQGSNEEQNFLVKGLGCAVNAITVGSINYSHNLVDSSRWKTLNTFLYKPDVVAPGGRLSGLANFDRNVGGTSCAAPMVTGAIALLMEEFPALKCNASLVKSIVHLGAEKLPSQTEYFDQQAGFGLINYQNMRECLLNSNYADFSILPSFTKGSIVLSHVVTIPSMKQINVNANLIFYIDEPEAENSDVITPMYTDYSIRIYDFESSSYVATSTINSTMDYLLYTNTKTQDSMFRIDIVVESSNTREQIELGSIAYEFCDHIHSYDTCVYLNKLFHQFVCACGATGGTGRHYIYGSDHLGEDSAPCHACGYWLDLRDDFHNITMSVTKVSVNGSYILPNGIVVLVDEDIEAYLAGTLQFYHPDDLPVTQ